MSAKKKAVLFAHIEKIQLSTNEAADHRFLTLTLNSVLQCATRTFAEEGAQLHKASKKKKQQSPNLTFLNITLIRQNAGKCPSESKALAFLPSFPMTIDSATPKKKVPEICFALGATLYLPKGGFNKSISELNFY